MKAKKRMKRLPNQKRLQALLKVSRPPEKLAKVLEAIDQIPHDLDFPDLPPMVVIESGRGSFTGAVGWPENPWIDQAYTVEGEERIASTLDPNISAETEWIMIGGN